MDFTRELKILTIFGFSFMASIALVAVEMCNKYPRFIISVIIAMLVLLLMVTILYVVRNSYKYKIRKATHPLIPFYGKHNTKSLSQSFVYYYKQGDIETVLNIITEPNYNPNMAFYSGLTYYPSLTDFVMRNYDDRMSEVYVNMLLDPRTDITLDDVIKLLHRHDLDIEILKLYIAFRLKSKDEINMITNTHRWVELKKSDSYTSLLTGLQNNYSITVENIKSEYYRDSVPDLHKLASEGDLDQIKTMIRKNKVKHKPISPEVSQSMEPLTPIRLWG